MIRIFAVLISGLALGAAALAQDAEKILGQVGEVYANLRTFDFHGSGQMTIEINGAQYRFSLELETAQGDTPDESLTSSFHSGSWKRVDGSPGGPDVSISMPSTMNFARIAQHVTSAKLLREEMLSANGKTMSCYVIDVLRAPPGDGLSDAPAHLTLWIDKATHLVLRFAFQDTQSARNSQPALRMDWVISFTSYQLNEPPPPWLVALKESAEKESAALTVKMIGTPAPDFVLQGIDGHDFSLASLHNRNKVVLLSFWATWCAPCRHELPLLSKIERDWSTKGLVVVRITGESPDDVNRFF